MEDSPIIREEERHEKLQKKKSLKEIRFKWSIINLIHLVQKDLGFVFFPY